MTVGFPAYLLSEAGLEKVGATLPGTADLGNLGKVEVPTSRLSIQRSFNQLQAEVGVLKAEDAAIRAANAAIFPATLEQIFRG